MEEQKRPVTRVVIEEHAAPAPEKQNTPMLILVAVIVIAIVAFIYFQVR